MKKLYKSTFISMFVVVLAVMTACGGGDKRNVNGVFMTNQKDIDVAFSLGNDIFEESDLITRVEFEQKRRSGVNKYAEEMRVFIYEEGNDSLQVIVFPLMRNESKPYHDRSYAAGWNGNKRENGVKYAEIDYSKIAEYLEKAGENVVAQGVVYEEPLFFSGVAEYTMIFDKDPKNPLHTFSVESRDTATSTQFMDEYYEFKFEVRDGKLSEIE